jgi:hypothetical protein
VFPLAYQRKESRRGGTRCRLFAVPFRHCSSGNSTIHPTPVIFVSSEHIIITRVSYRTSGVNS